MREIVNRFFEVYEYLKSNGKVSSQESFGALIGTNKAGVSDLKYERKKISIENLDSVKKSYPEINLDYIITGKGKLLNSENPIIINREEERNLIPLYDSIATAGMVNTDMSPVTEPVEYIDAGDWFRDATAAMRIHGDSMFPEYHSGSIAALKEIHNKRVIIYGQDYVFETEEYRVIKRIQKGSSDEYILPCSTNMDRWEDGSERGRLVHEPMKEIHIDEIRRLFLVLGAVRRNHSSRIVYNKNVK